MVRLLASEAGNDLQMTSKVISDPKFELTGLNDPSYYAFLTSKCFLEIIKRKEGVRLWSIDLHIRTLSQVNKTDRWSDLIREKHGVLKLIVKPVYKFWMVKATFWHVITWSRSLKAFKYNYNSVRMSTTIPAPVAQPGHIILKIRIVSIFFRAPVEQTGPKQESQPPRSASFRIARW